MVGSTESWDSSVVCITPIGNLIMVCSDVNYYSVSTWLILNSASCQPSCVNNGNGCKFHNMWLLCLQHDHCVCSMLLPVFEGAVIIMFLQFNMSAWSSCASGPKLVLKCMLGHRNHTPSLWHSRYIVLCDGTVAVRVLDTWPFKFGTTPAPHPHLEKNPLQCLALFYE